MIFKAKIQIALDEGRIKDLRFNGNKDVTIIHQICDEITRDSPHYLTELGEAEFTDCEIVQSKEKERLPF